MQNEPTPEWRQKVADLVNASHDVLQRQVIVYGDEYLGTGNGMAVWLSANGDPVHGYWFASVETVDGEPRVYHAQPGRLNLISVGHKDEYDAD